MKLFNKSEENNEDKLIEQLKILNTLIFLDSQYQHTDSIMSMEDIQECYTDIGQKLLESLNK